jgi:succinoglycan biosynthesis protein ExoL
MADTAMDYHGEFVLQDDAVPECSKYWDIAFFAQDLTDVTTIKRVQQFLNHGLSMITFGFRRDRYNGGYLPPWPHVCLGVTRDGAYWQRAYAVAAALRLIVRHRGFLKRCAVFYARNIDQLLLAVLARLAFNPKAEIVYEVLDIQPLLTGASVLSWMVRMVERLCLTQARLLVLSSPGFYRHYYAPRQRCRGPWLLIENKLLSESHPRPRPIAGFPAGGYPPVSRPWVIGYFGLIRGQATFDLIVRLAERLGDAVRFEFRGMVTTVDEAYFHQCIRDHDNMVFHGPYENPGQLAEIYQTVDFVWALDMENVQGNSRWLLPARFYEAGYFGIPCLAIEGFETGAIVNRLGVGWSFAAPLENELARFFENLTWEEYQETRARLLALPASTFVSGVDVDALCRVLTAKRAIDWTAHVVTGVNLGTSNT